MLKPFTPRSTSPCHKPESWPLSLSMMARTRVVGHCSSRKRLIVDFRRTCSSERPKSISFLSAISDRQSAISFFSAPARGGVAREPEAALGNDVALDVGGATSDQHAE